MKVYLRDVRLPRQPVRHGGRARHDRGGGGVRSIAARRRGRRALQFLRGHGGRGGRPAAGRSPCGQGESGAADGRHRLRRPRATTVTIAALPGVSDVIGGAPISRARAGAGPRTRRCALRAPGVANRLARAAAHSGRLRRALHVLRDDACARREPLAIRGRDRAEAARPCRGTPGDRDHGDPHRAYGEDIASSLGALLEATRRARPVGALPPLLGGSDRSGRPACRPAGGRCAARDALHLHAPLQSGCDRVLRRMGRHWYTAASYAAAVERLAARAPLLGWGPT